MGYTANNLCFDLYHFFLKEIDRVSNNDYLIIYLHKWHFILHMNLNLKTEAQHYLFIYCVQYRSSYVRVYIY